MNSKPLFVAAAILVVVIACSKVPAPLDVAAGKPAMELRTAEKPTDTKPTAQKPIPQKPTAEMPAAERGELAFKRWNATRDMRLWLRRGFAARPPAEQDKEAAANIQVIEARIEEAAAAEEQIWKNALNKPGK